MDQKPQFHGQKDSCAVQIKSRPAESKGNYLPSPVPVIYGVCPYGVFGAQLRKAEKRKVRTRNTSFNMSPTYQHSINDFSGEAKRRHYIYWWENNSCDG